MTKNKAKFDKFNISILTVQGLIAVFIIVVSLINIRSQELLLENRYNLLRGFVEKGEWYTFYVPAVIVLLIFVANLMIVRLNHQTVDKLFIHSYLLGSLIVECLALVVIMSMQSAVGF